MIQSGLIGNARRILAQDITMTKSLKEKAITIKGKEYVLVSDRVIYFNENYKNGCIQTKLLTPPEAETVVVKAMVMPDSEKPDRFFTGYSQARWGEGYINKSAALENAETSAVGRALAFMGIGVIDSIASVDELKKVKVTPAKIIEAENDIGSDEQFIADEDGINYENPQD